MSDQYALLWSKRANCFHVEPLEATCKAGLWFFQADQANDYLLLAVGSLDEVSDTAETMRPIVVEREEVRKVEAIWPGMKAYQRGENA